MNAGKFVADRGDKGQNRELGPDITRRIACPIDLRIGKMKAVLLKVSRDGRDITLSPAPVVDIWLINPKKPHSHR